MANLNLQKKEIIKFETDRLLFTDIRNNRVSLKLSDITALKITLKGMIVPVMYFVAGIFPFCMFLANRADGNDGTLSLLVTMPFWIYSIYTYLKLPRSKRFLQIGTKGNAWYLINCKEYNLNELISKIEKHRDDYNSKTTNN